VSEEGRLEPAAPVFTGLSVGAGPNTAAPLQKDVFSAGEDLVARIRFHINGEPFPIRFRWLTPERAVYDATEPVTVPFGCRSAWARLEKKGPMRPGRWKVQAFSGNSLAGEASFDVR
jgi:hypothetical protein